MTSDPFELQANRYDHWFERHSAVYNSELEAVRASMPAVLGRGLDIGSGTGRFALPFGIVEGVEPAAAMRRIANACGMKSIKGFAEALPYKKNMFDFALMVTTICFVRDAEQSLSEAFRVLQNGGRLIVGFVDAASALGKRYEANRTKSPFYRHARFFSAHQVEYGMEHAGFRNIFFRQTIFGELNAMQKPDPIRSGHGTGGFVTAAGIKPEADV